MFKFERFFTLLIAFLAPVLPAAEDNFNRNPIHYSPDGDTLYHRDTAIIKDSGKRAESEAPALLGTAPSGFIATTTWGPEVRLTFTVDTGSVSTQPRLASSGDTIVISCSLKYWGGRPGLPYLLRSTDGGWWWLPPLGFSNADTGQEAANLYINLQSGRLNTVGKVIWPQQYDDYNIYAKRSGNLGQTWTQPAFFFTLGQGYIGKFGGTSRGESLFVAFYHGVARHDRRVDTLKFVRSFDNGDSWTPDFPIIYFDAASNSYWFWPRYGLSSIHLLFQQRSPATHITEIFYIRSDDWGQTWSGAVAISDDSLAISQWPYLYATDDGRLCASWYDYKYGSGGGGFTGDILYRISLDNGESWGPELRLTSHHLATASRSFILDNTIGMVWEDARTGFFTPELYYAESSDMGQTWGPEVRLTEAEGASDQPELLLAGREIFLVWNDCRNSPPMEDDLYFRRADVEVGIAERGDERLPQEVFINCYPNPFNGVLNVWVRGQKGGCGKLRIFDIRGGLINELEVREGKATWDARDNRGKTVSSGIYFAQVETPQGKVHKAFTLIK